MDRNGNICLLSEHGYLFLPRDTAFSMLDLADFSEVKNERNIWEQLVPAVHGTESRTMFFSSHAVRIVHLQTHLIRQFCEVVFMHKRPSWLFIHETGWQSGGGGAQLPLLARILLINK